MRYDDGELRFTATDLSSFFECDHKAALELRVAQKAHQRPGKSELERRMLERRGHEHEKRVLAHYAAAGRHVVQPAANPEVGADLAASTLAAMREGAEVIYQGELRRDAWSGRPDFLVRVATPSRLGPFSYEPVDAKLAREEKARAVLQLCAYAELLESAQGVAPANLWLALGGQHIAPHALRAGNYMAYYRNAKRRLEGFAADTASTYPEPCTHCDICEWWRECEKRRRDDDHLSLVAGITRRQRARLNVLQTSTLEGLATLAPDVTVPGIEAAALGKIRHQAALQLSRRKTGLPTCELLTDCDEGTGLASLPAPTAGDLFLDLEGDAFVAASATSDDALTGQGPGLDYLFGYVELGAPEEPGFGAPRQAGAPVYHALWADSPDGERAAFEAVMDRIAEGEKEFSDLHIFHFGEREKTAFQKLACRYGTREAHLDQLLRRGAFVDLHRVVKHALRASVEAYTLKELEVFHGFERQVPLRDAARAMQHYGWWLETRETNDELELLRDTLRRYNEEDCLSTWRLREWLEARRPELACKLGRTLPRPQAELKPQETSARDGKNEETARVAERLRADLPSDPAEDSPAERAKRLLAALLGFHWRENKSSYWEYFAARDVPASEWVESRVTLGGLTYEGVVGEVARSYIHRYSFPQQEHGIRASSKAEICGTENTSAPALHALGPDFLLVKRAKNAALPEMPALRPGSPPGVDNLEARLLSLGRQLAQADPDGVASAAADLLLRRAPRCGQEPGAPLRHPGETASAAVARLCLHLDRSVLAIQGPPGAGKTYCAKEAIVQLARAGKKIGVTANSHSVIVAVLKKVHEAAPDIRICHVDSQNRFAGDVAFEVLKSEKAAAALAGGDVQVVGATSFEWAKEAFENSVDVLFVDEAGQMALANALAIAGATQSLVLVGDPAQLDQPQKGVHPDGADVSALAHIMGEHATMPEALGVFLPETRRLHPAICAFTSRLFYDGKLQSLPGLEAQSIRGSGPLDGSGLRFIPVDHSGNTNRSEEEVERVHELCRELLESGARFVDQHGAEHPLRASDVLVIAPYNAQVAALQQRLGEDFRVGTVDKFQGRQAPVVIYSMTTSSGDEAPRGLEFLYSKNRLNVASSRAQALVILVANPNLTKAQCRTPRQLQLVNALCGYLEMASPGQ